MIKSCRRRHCRLLAFQVQISWSDQSFWVKNPRRVPFSACCWKNDSGSSLAARLLSCCARWVFASRGIPKTGMFPRHLQILIESRSTLHLLMQSFLGLKQAFCFSWGEQFDVLLSLYGMGMCLTVSNTGSMKSLGSRESDATGFQFCSGS